MASGHKRVAISVASGGEAAMGTMWHLGVCELFVVEWRARFREHRARAASVYKPSVGRWGRGRGGNWRSIVRLFCKSCRAKCSLRCRQTGGQPARSCRRNCLRVRPSRCAAAAEQVCVAEGGLLDPRLESARVSWRLRLLCSGRPVSPSSAQGGAVPERARCIHPFLRSFTCRSCASG